MLKTKSGIFLFNIIPSYRPGMSKVFDHGFYDLACTPSLAQRTKQNTLYTSLEDIAGEGMSDLDLLYIMATDGTRTFAKINWADPGNFDGVESANAPIFTENIGFQGNAINANYINTQWAPSPDGVNYTLDECGAFCYINNETISASNFAFLTRGNGGSGTAGQLCLAPKLSSGGSDKHFFSLQSTAPPVGSSVTSKGFYHIRRIADNDFRLFKNGSQVGATQTTASDSLSTRDLYLLAGNFNGSPSAYIEAQMGIFGLGTSLTGQESALYTAWNTYFSSL